MPYCESRATGLDADAPSPVQRIEDAHTRRAGVAFYLKRDDLLHPEYGGNKWRKLKYNLAQAQAEGAQSVLTFGGAYSNHLLATAAATAAVGLSAIGVVRGEPGARDNPTLSRAAALGMHLHFVARGEYRRRHDPEYWAELRRRYGAVYVVPEGGSNALALPGVAEAVIELRAQLPRFDVVCCPVGSGGTLAGLASALAAGEQAWGFAVLRAAGALEAHVAGLLAHAEGGGRWTLHHQYAGAGYAKITRPLVAFCDEFSARHAVPLEPIYSGKMMWGLYDLLQRGILPQGSVVVALHTGGLQGLAGLAPRLRALRAGQE